MIDKELIRRNPLFKENSVVLHLIFWVIVLVFNWLDYYGSGESLEGSVLTTCLNIICDIPVAYIALWVYQRTMANQNMNFDEAWLLYICSVFALVAWDGYLFSSIAYNWDYLYKVSNKFAMHGELKKIADSGYFLSDPLKAMAKQETYEFNFWRNIPEAFNSILMLTGLYYITHWHNDAVRLGAENYKLEAEKNNLEKENLKLQGQLRPHFLINELSKIYTLIGKKDDDARNMLADICDWIRENMDNTGEPVSLKKEVEFIKNYIERRKQNYENGSVNIHFDIKEHDPTLQIAPMILICFVENAFKHGVSRSKNAWMNGTLETKNGELLFYVANSQPLEEDEFADTAIYRGEHRGIIKTRKLLKNRYPNQHELSITTKGDAFEVLLKIKLEGNQPNNTFLDKDNLLQTL